MTENRYEKPRVRYNSHSAEEVKELIEKFGLNTVCKEADCPNLNECFRNRTATFMILGNRCTRNCRFCNVEHGAPCALNENEAKDVAEAVGNLGLRHAVITSVTRDDLPHGGAEQFADVINEIHSLCPDTTVEVLIPDMKGDKEALDIVAKAGPTIIGHNMETVSRLYSEARAGADYERSLSVLKYIKKKYPKIITKTGFMLGLGETDDEIDILMTDIYRVRCDIITIGQYLRPSEDHLPVQRYITDKEFKAYEDRAYEIGFKSAVAGALVRSSYHALDSLNKVR